MPSTFTWLDYSEHERRRMLDTIELFGERTTRDELGLGGVRDAFADQLFPGTSTIQTRAKYFLLIPWMYLILERKQTSSAAVEVKGRKLETDLILALAQSEDKEGIIGKRRKENLQRLPSSIYWQGLLTWGIRVFPGSQDQYHRSLDLLYLRRHARHASRREFDGEAEPEADLHTWHSGLPAVPEDFPTGASLPLTPNEAEYLRERIISHCPDSLLAVLVRERIAVDAVDHAWELTSPLPDALREQLDHGENFSQILHGAQLLYNLMLAERAGWTEKISEYRGFLAGWWQAVQARQGQLQAWNRPRFWQIVYRGNPRVSSRARRFTNDWVTLVLASGVLADIVERETARRLIEHREVQLKGGLARLRSERALEIWPGAAGAGQLDLRWPAAQRIVRDILAGMEATPHA
jgi:Family of unknown function (DUF6361)